MSNRKPHDLRNIVRMDGAWWVRFFQGTAVLAQASFADSKRGGYDAALREAQDWRNTAEANLGGRSHFRRRPMRNKRSDAPVGVSATIYLDKRRGTQHLRFSVAYRKADGRKTNKVFETNIDHLNLPDWKAMAATAQAFREEYVWCVDRGLPFDPKRYADWRQERRYPFAPPISEGGGHA